MDDLTDDEIENLLSDTYDEESLCSGIHTVAILFSERSLPRLLTILKDKARATATRERAALAIRDIGAEPVGDFLAKLLREEDPELRRLAAVAISYLNKQVGLQLREDENRETAFHRVSVLIERQGFRSAEEAGGATGRLFEEVFPEGEQEIGAQILMEYDYLSHSLILMAPTGAGNPMNPKVTKILCDLEREILVRE